MWSLRQQNYLNYPTARLCVNYQLATLDLTLSDASAPHRIVFLLLFQLFPACCYVAEICRSSCGGPFGGGSCSAEHAERALIRLCQDDPKLSGLVHAEDHSICISFVCLLIPYLFKPFIHRSYQLYSVECICQRLLMCVNGNAVIGVTLPYVSGAPTQSSQMVSNRRQSSLTTRVSSLHSHGTHSIACGIYGLTQLKRYVHNNNNNARLLQLQS